MSIQQMFDPVMHEAVALERLRKVILDPMKRRRHEQRQGSAQDSEGSHEAWAVRCDRGGFVLAVFRQTR